MIYTNFELQDLKRKYLEISVWSLDSFQYERFLGQVEIHLSESIIFDDKYRWYSLGGLDNQLHMSPLPDQSKENNAFTSSSFGFQLPSQKNRSFDMDFDKMEEISPTTHEAGEFTCETESPFSDTSAGAYQAASGMRARRRSVFFFDCNQSRQ
jgi:hypothetical protein